MPTELRIVQADGLYTPEIKPHSLEKIRLHNRYASLFAAAMRRKWPQLAYIGLYAGAGHARRSDTGEIVESSALSVLRQDFPFTDYIFVENDPACVEALRARVEPLRGDARITIIPGDVNASTAAVIRALPEYGPGRGLLSFCFADPFDTQLRFDTIRELSAYRIDFLILLMLGSDARRNFRRYLEDQTPDRIGALIDDANWREEYRRGDRVIPFLLGKFDDAMRRLGYPSMRHDAHSIRVSGMGVFLYVLALYSRSELGQKFWRETRLGVSGQFDLGL